MIKNTLTTLLILFSIKNYSQTFSTYFTSYSICNIDEENEPFDCKKGSGGIAFQGVTIDVYNEIKLNGKNYEFLTNKWDNSRLVYNPDSDMYLYDFLDGYTDIRSKAGSIGIVIVLSNNFIPLALIQNSNVNGKVIQVINNK